MNLRRGECGVVCVCVCSNLYPPCIYSREPRVRLSKPTYETNQETTRGLAKAVGPTSQVGRPGWSAGLPVAPTAPSFVYLAVLGLLVWSMLVLVYLGLSELGS